MQSEAIVNKSMFWLRGSFRKLDFILDWEHGAEAYSIKRKGRGKAVCTTIGSQETFEKGKRNSSPKILLFF